MTRTLGVEGDVNSADTATQLTAQGSVATPSRLIPAGVTKIVAIHASGAVDFAAFGAAVHIIRLGGDAVQGGQQTFVIGSSGGTDIQSGSDSSGSPKYISKMENLNIQVAELANIDIQAEMVGADMGDAHIQVHLVYA